MHRILLILVAVCAFTPSAHAGNTDADPSMPSAADALDDASDDEVDETPLSSLGEMNPWLPSQGPECRRHGKRRYCQGPRKVPRPFGHAATLATILELGTRKTMGRILTGDVDPKWMAAIQEPRSESPLWPVPGGKLIRGFGNVRRRRIRHVLHKGIDVRAGRDTGNQIVAVQSGLVAYSDNNVSGYGNMVVIVHADATVSLYAHCKQTLVFAGQQVERGQPIAIIGATGLAKGAHLHFERYVDGKPQDPMPYLVQDSSFPKDATVEFEGEDDLERLGLDDEEHGVDVPAVDSDAVATDVPVSDSEAAATLDEFSLAKSELQRRQEPKVRRRQH